MNNKLLLLFIFILCSLKSIGQVVLKADGISDTNKLISEAFAPNYKPIESPGFKKNNCDNHSSFNEEHISQVYDSILKKYVFKFVIHVKEDNDRCKKFDRQRNEIKGYRHSPDNMKGAINETVTYEWKFKLSKTFTPSKRFTHLHQIKSVGEEPRCKPIFTLSAKQGKNTDYFQIRHSTCQTKALTLTKADLNLFKGKWVTVKETIHYNIASKGSYTIKITSTQGENTILEYNNVNIETWNNNAEFNRPKWGIYRSLLDPKNLKDEEVLFADFKITEH